MSIITLGDLLDRGREFEVRLEAFYAGLRDESRNPGVRLLTYYLARHRRHQDQALSGLGPHQVALLRKVELKHSVPFDVDRHLHLRDMPADQVTGEALLNAAVAYDQALSDLYRAILDQPLIDEIRAVLEALVRLEERDIVMMKKMLAMDYF